MLPLGPPLRWPFLSPPHPWRLFTSAIILPKQANKAIMLQIAYFAPLSWVALAATAAESLPLAEIDNLTVPLVAVLVERLWW